MLSVCQCISTKTLDKKITYNQQTKYNKKILFDLCEIPNKINTNIHQQINNNFQIQSFKTF